MVNLSLCNEMGTVAQVGITYIIIIKVLILVKINVKSSMKTNYISVTLLYRFVCFFYIPVLALQMLQTSMDTSVLDKMTDLDTCNLPQCQEFVTSVTRLSTENDKDVNQALALLSSAASTSDEFTENVSRNV